MTQRRASNAGIEVLLAAWPALTPDPQKMELLAQHMVAHMTSAPAATAAEPSESQFRALTIICGAVILAVYLAWSVLVNWFSLHPVWMTLLAIVGSLSLLAPLVLLPALQKEQQASLFLTPKGDTFTC